MSVLERKTGKAAAIQEVYKLRIALGIMAQSLKEGLNLISRYAEYAERVVQESKERIGDF